MKINKIEMLMCHYYLLLNEGVHLKCGVSNGKDIFGLIRIAELLTTTKNTNSMNGFIGYPISASALLFIVILVQWNLVQSQSCSNFVTRREWSELSNSDKNKCKNRKE
jgi:phosphatidylserine synthase